MMLSSSAVDRVLGIQTDNRGETHRPWTPGVGPPPEPKRGLYNGQEGRRSAWSATRRARRRAWQANPQVLTIPQLALTEHHRVHPQLNMQAARWPNWLTLRLRRWMARSLMKTTIGQRRTRRDLLSSTISSAPSACISTDARCTRRWRFGRRQTSFLV